MLQKEFEERINRSVKHEEFIEANAMYMAAGDIDKDTFCREWKQIGDSPLVKGLFETAYNLNQALQEHKLLLQEADEIRSDVADALLEIGSCPEAAENIQVALERKAWWLVGKKEVIKRKAKMGISFSEEEIEYINNNLK